MSNFKMNERNFIKRNVDNNSIKLSQEVGKFLSNIDDPNGLKLQLDEVVDSGKLYKLLRKFNLEFDKQKNEFELLISEIGADYATEENYQLMKNGFHPILRSKQHNS